MTRRSAPQVPHPTSPWSLGTDIEGGVIRWETPPPISTSGPPESYRPWAVVVEQLKSRPHQWAVIAEGTRVGFIVNRIRRGVGFFKPAEDFEVCQRTVDGTTTVYCRFVGRHIFPRELQG